MFLSMPSPLATMVHPSVIVPGHEDERTAQAFAVVQRLDRVDVRRLHHGATPASTGRAVRRSRKPGRRAGDPGLPGRARNDGYPVKVAEPTQVSPVPLFTARPRIVSFPAPFAVTLRTLNEPLGAFVTRVPEKNCVPFFVRRTCQV